MMSDRVRTYFFCFMLLFCVLSPAVNADNLLIELQGEPQPGGLLIGETEPDVQVFLGDKSLVVDDQGFFVLGFGRDDEGSHVLRLKQQQKEETWKLDLRTREWNIQHVRGVPPQTVSPPPEVHERIGREAAAVSRARSVESQMTGFRESFIWPVTGRITGVYGSQRIFDGEPRRPHFGVDIAAPEGTEILAPASGVITLAEQDLFFSGGTLIIDHGLGVSTTYLHLSELRVEPGEQIEQGQVIGLVGATGRATGPHLCWRLNWFQQRLDPKVLVGEMSE